MSRKIFEGNIKGFRLKYNKRPLPCRRNSISNHGIMDSHLHWNDLEEIYSLFKPPAEFL